MLNKCLICLMFFINLNFIVLRNNHISWRGHTSHAEGQMLESRSRRTKSFKQLATFPMRWSLSRMYCAALDAASKSFVTAQLQHEYRGLIYWLASNDAVPTEVKKFSRGSISNIKTYNTSCIHTTLITMLIRGTTQKQTIFFK